MPTDSLHSSALHWITKYLRDLFFCLEYILCVCYIHVCLCIFIHTYIYIHTHTHTIYIYLNSVCCVGQKNQSQLSHERWEGEMGMWMREEKLVAGWGLPFWKDFETHLEKLKRERRRGVGRTEGKPRDPDSWEVGLRKYVLKRQAQWRCFLPADQSALRPKREARSETRVPRGQTQSGGGSTAAAAAAASEAFL